MQFATTILICFKLLLFTKPAGQGSEHEKFTYRSVVREPAHFCQKYSCKVPTTHPMNSNWFELNGLILGPVEYSRLSTEVFRMLVFPRLSTNN